eukprot:356379-Prymnesium_polylepis.1
MSPMRVRTFSTNARAAAGGSTHRCSTPIARASSSMTSILRRDVASAIKLPAPYTIVLVVERAVGDPLSVRRQGRRLLENDHHVVGPRTPLVGLRRGERVDAGAYPLCAFQVA